MMSIHRFALVAAAVCVALAQFNQVAFAQKGLSASRNLRAEHNSVVRNTQPGQSTPAGQINPHTGGGQINPNTGVASPGGILGPLYAAFPGLLVPLAMASDMVHNTNAAISGVQHTPDGIFQA